MKTKNPENTPKLVPFLTLTIVLLTLIPLYYYPLQSVSFPWKSSTSPPTTSPTHEGAIDPVKTRKFPKKCDLFSGEWVRNPNEPYYTNETCRVIHDQQNCMKYGRPDTEFLKWRWKPNECELPIFNPDQFLELVRGKSLAFVGDSVGRNQMQSLICLLSRVEQPIDISPTQDPSFKRWLYPSHNFTIARFWAQYLVNAYDANPNGPLLSRLYNLYLDEPNKNWITEMEEFNYVIVSAGHWFFGPSMYYENSRLVGCHLCGEKNVTDMSDYYGYRMAFRTTFQALISLPRYKGVTFLRTFSPGHYENGPWNKGGNCVRKTPFRSNETRLEGAYLEMYMSQVEEFRDAEKEGRKRGLKFRLLDTTEAMLRRPDGHPDRFRHSTDKNVISTDCVHWCMPGAVDTWNEFLLEMLKDGR